MSTLTFQQQLEASTLSTSRAMVAGKEYPVRIVNPDLEPRLPNFVGKNEEGIYISAQVPLLFRPFIMIHEVYCLEKYQGPYSCVNALRHELQLVPAELKISYLYFRLQFFKDLVAYYEEKPPSEEFLRKILTSREYLKQLVTD